jgi:hypothetical protein
MLWFLQFLFMYKEVKYFTQCLKFQRFALSLLCFPYKVFMHLGVKLTAARMVETHGFWESSAYPNLSMKSKSGRIARL